MFTYSAIGPNLPRGPENLAHRLPQCGGWVRPQALRARGMDIPQRGRRPAPQDAKHAPAVNLRPRDTGVTLRPDGQGSPSAGAGP